MNNVSDNEMKDIIDFLNYEKINGRQCEIRADREDILTAQESSNAKSGVKIMASGKEYLHFILEQLSDLDDISYRPMMGEFKVSLLLGGAADYLTKPFDTKELLARVAVRLREHAASPVAAVYTYGDITLDTMSHEVTVGGQAVSLTRTEYAILKLLMRNPGQVLAKSVLLDRIAEDTPDCTENSLKTHISNLRGKLRDTSGKDYIEAVWGIGFRLNPEP